MIAYLMCITILFFLGAVLQAVLFGKKKDLADLIATFLRLGLAIWGLILIVLNWS